MGGIEIPAGGGGPAQHNTVSTIDFIQANLQHSIAASNILSRIVSAKRIYMALIQGSMYRGKCLRGLSVPGYTLYYAGGTDRPRSCILARNMDICILTRFSFRDLVAVLVKYVEGGVERRLVICSAYLPYDSEDPPPTRELEELVRHCEREKLYLVVGCDFNVHHTAWSSTNCNVRCKALINFLSSTNLEIFNKGNEPTFCSGGRKDVIDITLGPADSWRALRDGGSPRSPPHQTIDTFCSYYGAPGLCS
jgi:hypothetical protein